MGGPIERFKKQEKDFRETFKSDRMDRQAKYEKHVTTIEIDTKADTFSVGKTKLPFKDVSFITTGKTTEEIRTDTRYIDIHFKEPMTCKIEDMDTIGGKIKIVECKKI